MRKLWAFLTLAPLAGVAAALVSQHHFDMQPCAWCALQRLLFFCIAALGAAGWLSSLGRARSASGRWLPKSLALTLAAVCIGGIAAALWQHNVAASSSSCKLTLAERIMNGLGLDERWPQVFAAYASCAEASVSVLGLPYAYWSLALFAMLLTASVALIRAKRA